MKNKRPTWCHLLFYFTSYVLNMFRTLIYPSSRACDHSVELPHWSYCSWFDVCWRFGVVELEWYPCCRLKHNFSLQHGYHSNPTHRNSNTHRTKNNTTNAVIQQNSRELLMMDILMSETCWAHKKWNKIISDIKLVLYSSTSTNTCFILSLLYSSTCFEHDCAHHQEVKLHYTASGIITLKQVSGLKLLKYNSTHMST